MIIAQRIASVQESDIARYGGRPHHRILDP